MDSHSRTQRSTSHGSLAVKLTSIRDPRYFYVNWWLTDHCNWSCSYCHDILKRGDIPFPDIRSIKDFIRQLDLYSRTINRTPYLDITGGEVTEYPFLDEMLLCAKELGATVKIRTNASQSIAEFQKTISSVDSLEIEFHPEHTQTSHFMMCLSVAAKKENVSVSINFNALPDRFKEVEELADKVKEKWPQFNTNIKLLFEDPVRNTKPMIYHEHQKNKLKRQSGNMILEYEQDQEYTDYQTLILENKNQFENWQCNIGLEQIIVDAYGVVRRGHCRQGGSLGSLGNVIKFDGLGLTCKKSHCVNGFDILATKIKLS